ncbi:MAG: MFS transporter [Nitrososphaerota archaeon]|nr:MFS transporter [Nitrososphaerota archaeon]MDG6978240.1 MFS transporter [Nitrososphaerota archaeon]MDG7021700.1 MFS transporter [Nitrososphaerota archaeon]
MQYKWIVLSNTTLGTLMASLDTNIVLVALPTISRELHGTSFFDLLWVLLGYQLVNGSLLVNLGRLSDMFGRVRLYNFGFALFTAASALCSLAQSGEQLVGFRLLQGVGAAFLFSNSGAIITDAFPVEERGKALGINQVSIVVGSLLGLVLGGVLTTVAGWQSIFYVNIPIGIFATVWSHYQLKEKAVIREGQKIDLVGNVTFAGGLAAILLGITLDAVSAISFDTFALLLGAGLSLMVVFVLTERRVKEPMLDLSLFRIRLFSAGTVASLLNSLARGAVTLVLTFYLQGPSMGLDPLGAGIFLVPVSISIAVLGPVSGYLSDRQGPRLFATAGLVVAAAGFLLLTEIGRRVTFWQLAVPLLLVGAGMGLFQSPNRASIMNSVPSRARGIASGTSTTVLVAGTSFSLGLAFYILTAGVPIADLQTIFVGGKSVADAPWIPSFIASIHDVYYLSTAFVLAAIVPSVLRGQSRPTPEG